MEKKKKNEEEKQLIPCFYFTCTVSSLLFFFFFLFFLFKHLAEKNIPKKNKYICQLVLGRTFFLFIICPWICSSQHH